MSVDPLFPAASKKKKWPLIVGGLVILGLVGWTVFSLIMKIKFGDFQPPQSAPDVIVSVVAPFEFSDKIEAIGTLQAKEQALLTATVTETVSALPVADSAFVKKGDVIAELSQNEERALVQEANQAYQRSKTLVAEKFVSRARLDADLAALQVAQANLENRIIRAPFDGQIGIVQVDIGDLINAGTPIATIDNTALMETEFTVPEIQLPKLQQGMSIEARSDAYPDTVFQGIVSAIDTRIDPNSRAIRLKADIPNDDNRLKSGMLMKVNILQSTRQGLALPEKALMNAGEEITVFKVGADKKAQQTKVTTGIRMAGLVEITSGLSEGDQVIIEGQMKTQDKSEVKVTATKTIEDSIQAAMDYAVPRKQKALIEADEIVEPKTSETQP